MNRPLVRVEKKARRFRVSAGWVRAVTRKILAALGRGRCGVSVLLVGDRAIRALNRRYLGHDRPTDVIAFSQLEGRRLALPGNAGFLGDLVISLETATRQACEYGNPFRYELAFYVCHGILHLTGLSDKTSREAKRMENKQKAILRKIGLRPGSARARS